MNIELLLFSFFAALALISGIMVIASRNPIHSILSLIMVFLNAAGLLILLEVEYLAMVFLVVYVGAIAVLFLFVVMMLNIKLLELNENLLRYLPVGAFVAIIFLLEVFLIVENELTPLQERTPPAQKVDWASNMESLTNIQTLGELLYTHYFYLFLLGSLVLLVSMIGAIVLTLNHGRQVKRQQIHQQVARDLERTIELKS